MKISDLFGRTGVYGNSKAGAAGKSEEKDSKRVGSELSSDRTTISNKAKLLSEVSIVRDDEDAKRAARILEIKRRVEPGEYNVSSQDVAGKIVEFLGERV
jgi:flagellar biosynthesis anti-sigma factor FlgM